MGRPGSAATTEPFAVVEAVPEAQTPPETEEFIGGEAEPTGLDESDGGESASAGHPIGEFDSRVKVPVPFPADAIMDADGQRDVLRAVTGSGSDDSSLSDTGSRTGSSGYSGSRAYGGTATGSSAAPRGSASSGTAPGSASPVTGTDRPSGGPGARTGSSAWNGRPAMSVRQRQKDARGSRRQAQLTLARIEPWSVMKFSFVVSIVPFIILFVAVALLYMVLSALGVFDSLQNTISNLTSAKNQGGTNISSWFSASRVLGYTGMLGALNIVLITAISTIGAVIYNLIAATIGGIEVTLRETD